MAQKYIIGDLVKYKVGGLEFIAEITNTSKYGYCFKCVGDDISGTLCKEFTKDIPLTSEILEKNGWKIEDVNPHDFSNFESKGIMYRAIKDKEILFFQKGASVFTCPLNWRKIEIRYVHQLQHLLFGLGLNSEMEV